MSNCAKCGNYIGWLERAFGGRRVYETLCNPCNKLFWLEYIAHIRKGNLPTVNPSAQMYLDSDAICHMYIPATYSKEDDQGRVKTTTARSGHLIATNKSLCFLSSGKGATIQWTNIITIQVYRNGISIKTSKGVGAGFYQMSDIQLAHAILETSVKIAKRQLLPPGNAYQSDPSRNIPQHVVSEVWQKSGGRCSQCSAYGKGVELQVDHIIPFSRGGANTIVNLQLLCGVCNKKKGAKI